MQAGACLPKADKSGIERRIFRSMAVGRGGLRCIVSLPFAQWRVTTGLLLGGVAFVTESSLAEQFDGGGVQCCCPWRETKTDARAIYPAIPGRSPRLFFSLTN